MSDYMKSLSNFGNAKLQSQPDWGNWGYRPTPSSFNLDPLAGQNFGEYIPSTPDYGFGGASASSLGDVMNPGVPLSFWEQGKQAFNNVNWLDKTDASGVKTQGAAGLMLGGVTAGLNAYLGMGQLDMAKQTLAHNKNVFNKNFDAQRRTTNASLEDRQRSRVASNAGAYESVGSYMDKNRIV